MKTGIFWIRKYPRSYDCGPIRTRTDSSNENTYFLDTDIPEKLRLWLQSLIDSFMFWNIFWHLKTSCLQQFFHRRISNASLPSYISLLPFWFQCLIFTFNKPFDKENDCVYETVITKPHHWRRLFITFYIVNFLLFKNENSTSRALHEFASLTIAFMIP